MNRISDGELILNRDILIAKENELIELAKKEPGLYLNLGCGQKTFDSWDNLDLYSTSPRVIKADICNLSSYLDSSVRAIYSAHSIEHLSFQKALAALKEWHRVLVPGGTLLLLCPDVDLIAHMLLETDPKDFGYHWYLRTLYGYQIQPGTDMLSESAPVDLGQFHTCGFSMRYFSVLMPVLKFEIKDMKQYDGFRTPSVYVEAVKSLEN